MSFCYVENFLLFFIFKLFIEKSSNHASMNIILKISQSLRLDGYIFAKDELIKYIVPIPQINESIT